eukprot:GHVS01029439.1.p1 GENE.GHVS01029439.1~~GHVS01029439.1.p1  ORF type:complete len:661 (+),score=100.96 GHVS01029439.1:34-1983(+)
MRRTTPFSFVFPSFLRPSLLPSSLIGSCRHFAYADTLAHKLYGRKPSVRVVHPVLPAVKSYKEWVDGAEEAIGLVRSVKWQMIPGHTKPRGGWNRSELESVKALLDNQEGQRWANERLVEDGWHVDRGNESDEEFDLDDVRWRRPLVRKQLAESCLVRIQSGANRDLLFSPAQLRKICNAYKRQPSDVIFINCILTPVQLKNLELIFRNLLMDCREEAKAVDAGRGEEPHDDVGGLYATTYREADVDEETDEEVQDNEEEEVEDDNAAEGEDITNGVCVHDLFERNQFGDKVQVVDRHAIVLEIFAMRAHTQQAKLEVELARASYMRASVLAGSEAHTRHVMKFIANTTGKNPRLRRLSEEGVTSEFIGSKKGESYRDYQRRLVEDTLKQIGSQLQQVRLHRSRSRRARSHVGTVALVGYTNAGKTALMNRLTGQQLKERDLLFQTLDTTCRKIKLNAGHAVLVDSVGFIQDLPHSLYTAFQVTLEELTEADVLLHVRDMSHPRCQEQKQTVLRTLCDVGMSLERLESNIIEVWNKVDLLTEEELSELSQCLPPNAVPVCATDGSGCDVLVQALSSLLQAQMQRNKQTFCFPTAKASQVFEFLHRHTDVLSQTIATSPDGRLMRVEVVAEPAAVARYEKLFGEESVDRS